MPAYICPECDDAYPKLPEYEDDCPTCGTETKYRASAKPTVPDHIGLERLERRRNLEAFDRWCEENGRTEDDPRPLGELILPRNHSFQDLLLAQRVRDQLDEDFHFVGELHVFYVGA